MYYRKMLGIAWALGLTCTMTSCGSPILRANFESDAVGTTPGPDIPGDPVGDYFYLSSPTSGSARVIAAPAGLSGKSLSYRHAVPESYNRYMGFMGRETSSSSQQFWAVWNAYPHLADNVPLDVWIGNSHLDPICKLRYLNGQVFVENGVENYTPIGTYRNDQTHGVVIKVDKLSSTYQISVHSSRPAASTGVRPALDPSVLTRLVRPTVYFWFPSEGTSGSTYAIDDMLMTEACPTDRGVGVCE